MTWFPGTFVFDEDKCSCIVRGWVLGVKNVIEICFQVFPQDVCYLGWPYSFKVFVNKTNVTFLSFFFLQNCNRGVSKNKVASSGNWTHKWPSLVYQSDAHLTVLGRHVLTVSDFQILIKSCSVDKPRNDPSPKSEMVHETKFSLKISYSTYVCLAQLDRH